MFKAYQNMSKVCRNIHKVDQICTKYVVDPISFQTFFFVEAYKIVVDS